MTDDFRMGADNIAAVVIYDDELEEYLQLRHVRKRLTKVLARSWPKPVAKDVSVTAP